MLLAWVPIPLKKWLSSFLLAVLGSQGIVVKCPTDIFFFLNLISNQLFGHCLYSWPTQKASSVLLLFLFLLFINIIFTKK